MQKHTPQPQDDNKGPLYIDIGTEEERQKAGEPQKIAEAAVRAGKFLLDYR